MNGSRGDIGKKRQWGLLAALVLMLIGAAPHEARADGPGPCWMLCDDGCEWDTTGPSPPFWWDPACSVATWATLDTEVAGIGSIFTGLFALYFGTTEDPESVLGLQSDASEEMASVGDSIDDSISTQTEAEINMTQAIVDAKTQVAPKAEAMLKASIPGKLASLNDTCKVTTMRAAAAAMKRSSQNIGPLFLRVVSGSGAGSGAGPAGSSKDAGEITSDRCKLGLMDMSTTNGNPNCRYGKLCQNMGCNDITGGQGAASPLAKYIDADTRLSSVLDPLEYPVPESDHWQPLASGNISFIGPGGNNVSSDENGPDGTTYAGIGSELDFAVAWKFCEHLRAKLPQPTHNSGSPSPGDVVSMNNDSDMLARTSAAVEMCFNAIRYRTRCPSNAGNSGLVPNANGSGQDCNAQQTAVCNRLADAAKNPATGVLGLGLQFVSTDPDTNLATGDQALANILKACQNGAGISAAAYDWIMAHRCEDDNYVKALRDNLGSEGAEEHAVNFECQKAERSHDKILAMESANLQKAIATLVIMSSHMGASSSAAARGTQ